MLKNVAHFPPWDTNTFWLPLSCLHWKWDWCEDLSYLKVSAINTKKLFEFVIRNWNCRPNLFDENSKKEKKSDIKTRTLYIYPLKAEIEIRQKLLRKLTFDRTGPLWETSPWRRRQWKEPMIRWGGRALGGTDYHDFFYIYVKTWETWDGMG